MFFLTNLPITSELAFLFLQQLYYRHREDGSGLSLQEAYELFAKKTGLSNSQRNQRMDDNRLHWNNRVQQAVRILKYNNLANSDKRGYWEITPEGKDYIEKLLPVPN